MNKDKLSVRSEVIDNRQTDKWKNRQTDQQKKKQADKQTNRPIEEKQTDKQTNRRTDQQKQATSVGSGFDHFNVIEGTPEVTANLYCNFVYPY